LVRLSKQNQLDGEGAKNEHAGDERENKEEAGAHDAQATARPTRGVQLPGLAPF